MKSPFAAWFAGLDAPAAAKVTVAMVRLEQGNLSTAKAVGKGVHELRISFGPGYRVCFGADGDRLIILLGAVPNSGSRKTSQTPRPAGVTTRAGRKQESDMAGLTREFRETVKARAGSDPAFRAALLSEAVDLFVSGDVLTGKAVLRDYINATVGFEQLAVKVGKPPKSLIRMLSEKGNPTAANLFSMISCLQQVTGVHLSVGASA
jgi:putative addiction module killer protein